MIFINTSANICFNNSISLLTILKEAKNHNDSAILFFINKYTPLIKKHCFSYHLKEYDTDDLTQIGNISVINAINKFNLEKFELTNLNASTDSNINKLEATHSNTSNKSTLDKKIDISIDSFMITCIRNDFRKLARKNIKYQSESSLNVPADENYDIQSLIPDEFDLEGHIIDNMNSDLLKTILNSLSPDELELLTAAYLTDGYTLFKYCNENNLNYHKKRRQLISLLQRLRLLLKP